MLQESVKVACRYVLAEHHHRLGGIGRSQVVHGAQAIVGHGRWHAHIGDNQVKIFLPGNSAQFFGIRGRRNAMPQSAK